MCIILGQVKFPNEFAERHLSRTSLLYSAAGGRTKRDQIAPVPAPCKHIIITKYYYSHIINMGGSDILLIRIFLKNKPTMT